MTEPKDISGEESANPSQIDQSREAGRDNASKSVRKKKDSIWRVRVLITVPNWAVIELLSDGKYRTNREIYAALGKQFTRKTLIASLRTLSLEIRALEPQHVKSAKAYQVGYSLSKPVAESIAFFKKLNAELEKK